VEGDRGEGAGALACGRAGRGGVLNPQRGRASVFLSYARSDGEAFARRLRDRLEAEGIALWRDREGMEGGRDWWQQITAAIDEVEFLVLVMTDAALASHMVRREWRYARQRGVVVYPVLADPGLDLASLPRWMRSVHFYDSELEWTKFLNDLRTTPQRVRVPFMVEDMPVDFVARPREFEALASHLVDREREEAIPGTAVLCGAGGFGKTALVRALCHEEAVQNAFDDGILWVTLGENPGALTGRVEDLIAMLSGRRPGFAGLDAATASFVELLADRDLLIVIDDVWNAAHLTPFLQGGERCARVVTTRNADVIPPGARRVDVDAMRGEEATALVGFGVPAGSAEELRALASRLGEWPLLLKLVNAALRERLHRGQALAAALAYVHTALDKRGLTFFDAQNAGSRHQAVATTLGLSIAQLKSDEQQRFDELAVFAEDVEIPLDVVARLWGRTGALDEFDTETLCDKLSRLSLVLLFDPTLRFVRLHDVVRKFLLTRAGDRLSVLHGELLAALRPASGTWADLQPRERYGWAWLFHHLVGAGAHDELRRTAQDLGYLAAKAAATSPLALEADLAIAEAAFPDDPLLRQLRRSTAQSAHLLARCGSRHDVASTLCSRLGHLDELRDATAAFAAKLDGPRLAAAHVLPDLPHPALVRTLVHRGRVLACAIRGDGRKAFAAADRVIKAWDVASGREEKVFEGHTAGVNALALSADGALLVSGSSDRRVRLWDAQTGEVRAVLAGHTAALTDCAIAPDGSFVVTTSLDASVRIWGVASGSLRHVLARTWSEKNEGWFVSDNDQGHWSGVQGCAVSPDGRCVASGSSDQTIVLWDVERGVALRVLSGHDAAVNACAFSPDGRLLASASADRTLRLWERDSGAHGAVLHHDRQILTSCAFTPDGGAVVCGAADGSLAVVDVSGARAVQRMSGHTDWVNDCAVSADGRLIISGSSDGSAKIWDATVAPVAERARVHSDWVLACAAEPGGLRVVTAAADRSLIRWDAVAGVPLRTIVGHDGAVRGCAVAPSGELLASASADKSVRLWDAPSGRMLFALTGHRDWVNSCAIDVSGGIVASVSNDRTLRLWDLRTRSRKLALFAHDHWVNSCAFSPDGRFVVTAAGDGSILRWSLGFDESVWELWITGVKRLPADVAERALQPLALEGHEWSVNQCAFAPDGAFMVSASSDGRLFLWDVSRGEQLGALVGHAAEVNGCDVSPDSSLVASVSSDGAVKIWDARNASCLTTLHVDGSLSSCTFAQGGKAVVAVGDMGVYFLDLAGFASGAARINVKV